MDNSQMKQATPYAFMSDELLYIQKEAFVKQIKQFLSNRKLVKGYSTPKSKGTLLANAAHSRGLDRFGGAAKAPSFR